MEAFTTKGHWWLPGDNPNNAIAGILTFDPRGQSELDLFDAFGSFADQMNVGTSEPIILGIGEKGQALTLVDNLKTNSGLSSSNYSWQSSTYITHFVIQGHHFKRRNDITFTRLWLDFYGLEKWASTGKKWEPIDFGKLPTERPTEDDVELSMEEFKLLIHRGFSFIGTPQDAFSVKRVASVELNVAFPWGYEEFISKIFQFQVFLSLAMGTSTWPISIKAPNPDRDDRQISFHFRPVSDFQEKTNLSEFLMVFALEDVIRDLEQYLRNWFSKCEDLEQVIGLYSWTISKRIDLEQTFLARAKAVEAYHRQMHSELVADKERFGKALKAIRKALKSSIPTEEDKQLRQRIYESANLAKGPSLRGRLEDIHRKHRHLNINLFEEFNDFIDDVVSHRNYLTHYDEDIKRAKKFDEVIVPMCEKLKYILEICLLSEMGFDEQEMAKLVSKMRRVDPFSSVLRSPQTEL